MLKTSCFGNKFSPSLIFLHGLFGSTEDFLPMIKLLKKNFYCVGIDLPGHGQSPPLHPLSFLNIVDKLLETILALKVENPSLVGYSLGGRLAMLLHEKSSSFFHKVFILSAHPGLEPEEIAKRLLVEDNWLKLLEELSLRDFLIKWYQQPLFQTLSPEALIAQRAQGNKKALLDMMNILRLSNQPSVWDHLSNTQDKWLFISGEKDRAYTNLYKKLPPLCQSVILPNVSHAIHLEASNLITLLIKKILF